MAYSDIPARASDAGPEPEREDREPMDDGQEDRGLGIEEITPFTEEDYQYLLRSHLTINLEERP